MIASLVTQSSDWGERKKWRLGRDVKSEKIQSITLQTKYCKKKKVNKKFNGSNPASRLTLIHTG